MALLPLLRLCACGSPLEAGSGRVEPAWSTVVSSTGLIDLLRISAGGSTVFAHAAKTSAAAAAAAAGAPWTGHVHAVTAGTGGLKWSAGVTDTVMMYHGGTVLFSAAGRVFASRHNESVAIDHATGEVQWRFDCGGAPQSAVLSSDERVLFLMCPSGGGSGTRFAVALFGVNAATGAQLWTKGPDTGTHNLMGGLAVVSEDPELMVGFGQAASANLLFALSASTGESDWSIGQRPPTDNLGAIVPVVSHDSKTLFVGLNQILPGGTGVVQTLVALDAATGVHRWEVKTGPDEISQLHVSADDKKLWFSSLDGSTGTAMFTGLDTATGDWLWTWQLPEMDDLPVAVHDSTSTAFFMRTSSDQNRSACVFAADAESGRQLWSVCHEAPGEYISLESAALMNDGSVLLVCFGKRVLVALEPSTGETRWQVSTGGDAISLPLEMVAVADASTVWLGAGGTVYSVNDAAAAAATADSAAATAGADDAADGADGASVVRQTAAFRHASNSPWNPHPVSRGSRFTITRYGAVGDNSTLNTAAFERAFSACAHAGGGFVEVPKGAFRTGTVHLASNCYLLLQPGGVVQGSTVQTDYGDDWDFWSIVLGLNVSNTGVIAPTPDGPLGPDGGGGGEIRGVMWQMVSGYNAEQNTFTEAHWPGAAGDRCGGVCKPGNLFLQDSANITVSGVSITESAGWSQIYRRVRNLNADRLLVENSVQWGGGDGMDVESGFNLTFSNSRYKNGDDNLAFRSGSFCHLRTPWPAVPIAPVQMVRIKNMSLTSSSSAIKFEASTEMSGRMAEVGDVFDVEVDGVTITDTNRGIGIWQRTSFGALRDMRFTNINMTTRTDPKPV